MPLDQALENINTVFYAVAVNRIGIPDINNSNELFNNLVGWYYATSNIIHDPEVL